ncbi:MAG TPA: hypothetical protein VGL83_14670 [Stellaceae bacterium]|jgi:protein ImuA
MAVEVLKNARQVRLVELRHYLAAAEGLGQTAGSVLPFAIPAIDSALPWGGLPLAALHAVESAGAGKDGAAAMFLAGILARLAPARPVLWCLPQADLHAPGLALAGLAAARLLLVRVPQEREILWVLEEGLRSRALAAVVGEVDALSIAASRRLQLAAENSGVTAFVLQRSGEQAAAASAAVTRWRVAALPSAPAVGEPGIGQALWRVELLRCRGGMPAAWEVEACNAAGHVALSAALADRPAVRQLRAAG